MVRQKLGQLKDLSREAVTAALESAGMDKKVPEVAAVGNAAAVPGARRPAVRAS